MSNSGDKNNKIGLRDVPTWIQAFIALGTFILTVLGSVVATNYVKKDEFKDLNNKVETQEQRIHELEKQNQVLIRDKNNLEGKNQDLIEENKNLKQTPIIVDGINIQRPVLLETKIDLKSRNCNEDVKSTLLHIIFRKDSRMEWVFSLANKTSINQDITYHDHGGFGFSLIDNFGKKYPLRYYDKDTSINPNANIQKSFQFDFPRGDVTRFDVDLQSGGCLSFVPFSVTIPAETMKKVNNKT